MIRDTAYTALAAAVMISPFILGGIIGELISRRKPRTQYTTAQLVTRRRQQIERNRARKTTKQQKRTNPQ
jgi:hypothetical protein